MDDRQHTFSDAMKETVKEAVEKGEAMYLYKNKIGNFRWGISAQYWHDWLFKAYPGGRCELSTEGTKLYTSEQVSSLPSGLEEHWEVDDYGKVRLTKFTPYKSEIGGLEPDSIEIDGKLVMFTVTDEQYLCERCGYPESEHPNKKCAAFARR